MARAASSKGTVSSVPAWFRADSGTNLIKQGEIIRSTVWLGRSVVRVLAQYARGPVFESRSDHVLSPPLSTCAWLDKAEDGVSGKEIGFLLVECIIFDQNTFLVSQYIPLSIYTNFKTLHII